MEYKRILPQEDLLKQTATSDTLALVKSGRYELCMIAGFEDDRLMCYALYSHVPGETRDVFLEHFFTLPGEREKGICSALFAYCEEYLRKHGAVSILSRIFLRPNYALEIHRFLSNRGFLSLNLSGRMLHYRLGDMLDAGTIQTVLKKIKKLPAVKTLKTVGERSLNALLSRHKETGFFFYKDELDPEYSRFYEEDGVIHGAIIASMAREDALYISALYMDREAVKKQVFLGLFCTCVAKLALRSLKETIHVIFMLNYESVYDGLLKVFNPPDEEYLVLEHMKPI